MNIFHKIFDTMFEIWGWVRIMLSPLLMGTILAVITYFLLPTAVGLVIGGVLMGIGLMIGILWANKIYKSKKGTMGYLSQTDSWPELDDNKGETN